MDTSDFDVKYYIPRYLYYIDLNIYSGLLKSRAAYECNVASPWSSQPKSTIDFLFNDFMARLLATTERERERERNPVSGMIEWKREGFLLCVNLITFLTSIRPSQPSSPAGTRVLQTRLPLTSSGYMSIMPRYETTWLNLVNAWSDILTLLVCIWHS